MASRSTALLIAAAMAVVVVGALLPATPVGTSAGDYIVGYDSGWDVGVNYNAWASGKTFKVGDTLVFLYPEAYHNVVMVDAQSYAACTVPSNAPTLTSGYDRVKLGQAGWWLFICGVEGHCESGMKLAVYVQ